MIKMVRKIAPCFIFVVAYFALTPMVISAPNTNEQFQPGLPVAQSQDAENKKAQNLINRGNAAYRAGDYAAAVAFFTELLGTMPGDTRALYNRGNAYYKLQDLDRALLDFSAVLEIDPKFYLALMNRANIYSRKGRYQKAIVEYDRTVALQPDEFLVFYNRGVAQERAGDIARALRDLTEAIRLNPRDAQSYVVRGGVYVRSGQPGAARYDFTAALRLDPSNQFASRGLSTLGGADPAEITEATPRDMPVGSNASPNGAEIDAFFELVEQSCLANGEQPDELRALARSKSWVSQSTKVLQQAATKDSSVINGWTATGKFGTAAVMQSEVFVTPPVYVCSITTKFVTPASGTPFNAAFENYFKPAVFNIDPQQVSNPNYYWLKHTANCDAKVTVIGGGTVPIVTIRMIHGRKRTDGS